MNPQRVLLFPDPASLNTVEFHATKAQYQTTPASLDHEWKPTGRDSFCTGDSMGEGDTQIAFNLLSPDLAEVAFDRVLHEVKWNTMHHRGGEVPRLVAVQGEVDVDGSYPIYRHPADESPPLLPFSPTVSLIRRHVENALQHPVNHVLIQLYRSGADYISEHSDKTVDVVRGSNIVNVSLGAQRTMTLRTKKDVGARRTQRVPLPHNSMFVLGPRTNARWMHAVRRDHRPDVDGVRISLTFRHIGTFLMRGGTHVWGQGARAKERADARPVVCGGPEAEQLIIAFGSENHQSDFDWDVNYGIGYDVVHLSAGDSTGAEES